MKAQAKPKPSGHGCGTGADAEAQNVCPDDKAASSEKQAALESLCARQLQKRGLHEDQRYAERLEYELGEVSSQGKADYLIGLARKCREEGVHYPENENGLLVEWLLNITPQDPVKHDIPHKFKFFGDAPDVDLDFCSQRKPEVEEYLKRKYGEDHVVHIGAYGTFSAKSALKEMARAHGLMETGTDTEIWFSKFAKDFDPFDPVSKESVETNLKYLFGEESDAPMPPSPWTQAEIEEGRRFHERYKEIFDLASKVVGQITHFTAHAAGVGIFPKAAWLHMPLKFNPKKGQIQTALQEGTRFKEITQAGIIKIDVLGLTLNSVMSTALRLIQDRHGVDLWDAIWPKCERVTREAIDNGEVVLDIDDSAILQLARAGQNTGSFQFGSSGISSLLKRIHPDSFEDIVAANALYRPGTIRAGEAEAFAWRKAKTKRAQNGPDSLSTVEKKVLAEGYVSENGKRKPKYTDYAKLHPAFSRLLGDTHGSLVYQEQVMMTFHDIAGFSMQESDSARKTLVKAAQAVDRQEKLTALSESAAAAASQQGMSGKDVDKLIEILANFSGYSFNKSHSTSYALAYAQVQFLKVYYPIEFLAALLSFSKNSTAEKKREDDPDLHLHIQEANRLGFQVVRPLCNRAMGEFTIHKVDDLSEYLSEDDAKSKGGEVLMWGLQHMLGVGEKQAAAIMSVYPVRDLDDFCERVDGRVVNKNVISKLIKIGFFDTLYEDDPPHMRRILAWRHFHEERQGMMTLQAAVRQVKSQFQEAREHIASLSLTPSNLAAIEVLEAKARDKAKELREAGDSKAVQRLYKRKRDKVAELDPENERKVLKSLLREVEKCQKTKKKLEEKPEAIVYSDLADDTADRITAERDAYGMNVYTNALAPHMDSIRELAKWAPQKHRVTIPEAAHKVPPAMRQSVTIVGELQSVRKLQYSDKSGSKKMRLVGKLAGRNGSTVDLVAFNIGDDVWVSAHGSLHKVVAVTGRLGEYRGSPQVMLSKRTDWLKRPGIEPIEAFAPAFKGHHKRRKQNG